MEKFYNLFIWAIPYAPKLSGNTSLTANYNFFTAKHPKHCFDNGNGIWHSNGVRLASNSNEVFTSDTIRHLLSHSHLTLWNDEL